MKNKRSLLFAIALLSLTTTASAICVDCFRRENFKHTYLKRISDDNTFLIKGVASDVYEHGREIKVIEDLKGNLSGKSSVFVWGTAYKSCADSSAMIELRVDDITRYQAGDTLIMFIEKARKRYEGDIETSNDYATLECYYSILKFSNGYVSGKIYWLLWPGMVLWEELQNELQEFINLEEKPLWWTSRGIYPDAFVTAYKGEYDSRYRFFIQGRVLEPYGDYGKKIQLITDLKDNFPKETPTVIVWGEKMPYRHNFARFDDLSVYNDQDTLLMLLDTSDSDDGGRDDYATLYFAFSVLKLSNNSVSGHITSPWKEETMSWKKFQLLLDTAIGIDDTGTENDWLSVYPNPASDRLYIDCNPQEANSLKITLFNANGQVIKKHEEHGVNAAINLDGLISGLYFVQVTLPDNQKIKTVPVIVQK